MTDAERQLLIAVARVLIAQTASRHGGEDEALRLALDAVTKYSVEGGSPPDPKPAA